MPVRGQRSGAARKRERLVVIGNGMASLRLLEELVAAAPGAFDVTVVGEEAEPAYNRVLLSPLLAGELSTSETQMKPRAWYEEHGFKLLTGERCTAIDAARRLVRMQSGLELAYDRLVLATGSDPLRPPIAGADRNAVLTFRTSADVARIRQAAGDGRPVVVIGGGLLGIECAYGLARTGATVVLLHLMDRLMERQLDAEAGARLRDALAAKGITVFLEAQTMAIEPGEGGGEIVRLADGLQISCAAAVLAIGITPRIELARSAGLATKRGIVVDDALATSVPGIYALGECAEHRGRCYGLVEPAYEQAKVLAGVLAGGAARYEGSTLATNLKVSGVPVFSAGDFEGRDAEAVVLRDDAAGSYRKLVIRDGRLAGAVLFGDTADALWYRALINSGVPIDAMRASIALGKAYTEAA